MLQVLFLWPTCFLLDCIDSLAGVVPSARKHAGRRETIRDRGELVAARSAFLKGLVAVALEHEVGGAPDVDLGYHGNRLHVLDR